MSDKMQGEAVSIGVHRGLRLVVDKAGDLWALNPETGQEMLIASTMWTARFAIECLQRISIHVKAGDE